MTRGMRRGLAVAALHVAIAASLGGKLLVERAWYPRVWARTAPVDPDLPIRGRYVRLRVEVEPARGFAPPPSPAWSQVSLWVDGDRLVAYPSSDSRLSTFSLTRGGEPVLVLSQTLAYFIPERVPDPSRRPAGEELWVEVTVPEKGSPRPIRLGVRKGGVLTPLEMQ